MTTGRSAGEPRRPGPGPAAVRGRPPAGRRPARDRGGASGAAPPGPALAARAELARRRRAHPADPGRHRGGRGRGRLAGRHRHRVRRRHVHRPDAHPHRRTLVGGRPVRLRLPRDELRLLRAAAARPHGRGERRPADGGPVQPLRVHRGHAAAVLRPVRPLRQPARAPAPRGRRPPLRHAEPVHLHDPRGRRRLHLRHHGQRQPRRAGRRGGTGRTGRRRRVHGAVRPVHQGVRGAPARLAVQGVPLDVAGGHRDLLRPAHQGGRLRDLPHLLRALRRRATLPVGHPGPVLAHARDRRGRLPRGAEHPCDPLVADGQRHRRHPGRRRPVHAARPGRRHLLHDPPHGRHDLPVHRDGRRRGPVRLRPAGGPAGPGPA